MGEEMRDRQGLAKLPSMHRTLHQFGKKSVCVKVKSLHICACQNYKCVDGTTDIKLRSTAVVHTTGITDGQRGLCSFPVVQHSLRTQENIPHAVSGSPISCEVHYRFSHSEELQARCDGKLHNFVEAVAR